MSNKEQVLSRCKAVVQSGGKCPESGVYVYWHMDFYELCYDGAKMYVNADGTGDGFEAAAKWLGLHNPWRLTSEELPEKNTEVLANWGHSLHAIAHQYGGLWYHYGRVIHAPAYWVPIPPKPE